MKQKGRAVNGDLAMQEAACRLEHRKETSTMNIIDRLQHTFPFIGGVAVLIIGAMSGRNGSEIQLAGLIIIGIGLVIMLKGPKSKTDRSDRC